jgi:GTPase Era involved in 16S rRNA processing
MDARKDMEKMFEQKIMLTLWVKVKGGWYLFHQSQWLFDQRDLQKSLHRYRYKLVLNDQFFHKTIGMDARKDMEKMFEQKIMLTLWVKVKGGWSDDKV